MTGIFVALLITAILVLFVIALLAFFYADGRNDRAMGTYLNQHGGLLGWLYDLGYNAVDAEAARRGRNFIRNRKKRLGRGE